MKKPRSGNHELSPVFVKMSTKKYRILFKFAVVNFELFDNYSWMMQEKGQLIMVEAAKQTRTTRILTACVRACLKLQVLLTSGL